MDTQLLNKLKKTFNLSSKEIEQHREYYNNHFDKYGNEIYEDTKTRFVHLLNFWDRTNWFNKRFNLLFKNYSSFTEIIEIGFGLPYLPLYLKRKNILNTCPHLILIDKYDSARLITEQILKEIKVHVDIITSDIETENTFREIKKYQKTEDSLLVAIEVVEHLKNPEKFWNLAKKISPKKIIVSLPIGPKISSHNLVFRKELEARKYLKKYIVIEKEELISPKVKNIGKIDDYKSLIVYGKLKQ